MGKPIVHIIDREADSVGHYREWTMAGHKVLIRADDRRVLCDGREMKLSEIRKQVHIQQAFQPAGPAIFHGREVHLEVAEVAVVLHRPGRKTIDRKRIGLPGDPFPMRLILTRVVDTDGKVLAEWCLLTNVPVEWADAAKLARCYYWRWWIVMGHERHHSPAWSPASRAAKMISAYAPKSLRYCGRSRQPLSD